MLYGFAVSGRARGRSMLPFIKGNNSPSSVIKIKFGMKNIALRRSLQCRCPARAQERTGLSYSPPAHAAAHTAACSTQTRTLKLAGDCRASRRRGTQMRKSGSPRCSPKGTAGRRTRWRPAGSLALQQRRGIQMGSLHSAPARIIFCSNILYALCHVMTETNAMWFASRVGARRIRMSGGTRNNGRE